MHDLPLVTTIAAAFTCAWIFGLLTQRLGLSPIVGYLLAGVLIGPHTPGFVGDVHLAQQLAEVGVILLMFGVGLHFHVKDLVAVRGIAIPGAVGQSLAATLLAMAIFTGFGMPLKTGMVMGMACAVASTVVLMRVLMDRDMLDSTEGHVAVGWLLVEDLFTVVLLVLIPALGEANSSTLTGEGTGAFALVQVIGLTFLKLAVLIALVLLAGSRLVPWILVKVARLRSRELFTLTILVFSVAVAAGAYVFFGASVALGAFLAGMLVAQSPVSHQAAADALPMRDAFAVLFFVSVGMLFDPALLLQYPLMILATLGIVLVAKPLAALVIVGLLGHSSRTALTVAIGLGQIGEFSFILSDLARRHGLMPDSGHGVLVATAILSITLNPLLFRSIPSVEAWIKAHPRLWRLLNARAEQKAAVANLAAAQKLAGPGVRSETLAIVVGFGPVGRAVHRLLREGGRTTVVIDLNMDTVSALRDQGHLAVFGDASHESILEQAGLRRASHLVITLPSAGATAVVAAARGLNANTRIFVRARYLREREELEQAGANMAVFEEAESAIALSRLVLADSGMHRMAVDRKIRDLRLQLITENLANISSQRVRSVMVPWSRVRWLPALASRDAVLVQVAQERFSRWPVVDPRTRRVTGYLHAKDLIARASDSEWAGLVRPLECVSPEETIESVLANMQSKGESLYVVGEGERPLGIVTLGDLIEQVVGQIEDEYPHEPPSSLANALARGEAVLDLRAKTPEEAVAELVSSIPAEALPPSASPGEVILLVLERERQVSTGLGNGVAVPHARVAGLTEPVAVFGRSGPGIVFDPEADGPVHLLFLLITPDEQPGLQLSLLSHIAGVCREESVLGGLLQATSKEAVVEIITASMRRKAGRSAGRAAAERDS